MKKLFQFSTFVLCGSIAFFTACRKDDPIPPIEEEKPFLWGSVKATVNDSLIWEGQCSAFLPIPLYDDSLFAFYFTKLNDFGVLRHAVAFYPIPIRVGKYQLHNDSAGLASRDLLLPRTNISTHLDYDIVTGFYYMNETDTIQDFLEITEIDFDTKELKGRFQASYYVDSLFKSELDYFFPDTVVFRDCTFHAKYEL